MRKYNSIEEIICDDSISPKVRVDALNRYEEAYCGAINTSELATNFGRIYDQTRVKANQFGMIAAESVINYLR